MNAHVIDQNKNDIATKPSSTLNDQTLSANGLIEKMVTRSRKRYESDGACRIS